ncbi:MAG TPA: AI-2E family transporter [Candidatus Acidoferrales bacterium]|nr:AI-2E family transporter [Candidatus Acidoferrales bacterium]
MSGLNLTTPTTSQKRLGSALFYGIVILLVYLAYLVFAPFFAPLAWATVLVVVSHPAYAWMARRWGATNAAIAGTIGVTLILIVPALFVMIAFVQQAVVAVQLIQLKVSSGHFVFLWQAIQARFPNLTLEDLNTSLQRYGEQSAAFVAARLGTILKNAATLLFHLGVTILAMFYLFRDGPSIVERLREILPFEETHRNRMLDQVRALILASVTSSLVAAALHGMLGGAAFALTGIRAPIFWGVMMGFFSFVPVVGSALIWVPMAISLFVAGQWGRAIVLVICCSVIVGLVDNLVRPLFISGRAAMSGLVIFISVLGGISAFGLLGVVLGPIVVVTTTSLLDLYAPTVAVGNS